MAISHIQLQPGHRVTIWLPAETGERFAPGALDGIIGSVVPVNAGGTTIAHGLVITADVAGNGSGVSITYEITAVPS